MEANAHNPGQADRHDHENELPKDVLNKEQDENSFRDPLEVQKEKEAGMKKVSGPIDDTDPAFRPKDR